MCHRPALVAALSLMAAVPLAAQPPAALPDAAALDRLHLTNEWTSYLPLEGQKDAIETVQMVDADQIFVQSKAGLLVALDADSGTKQWTYKYPASYSTVYPVAITRDYVFALNVARIFCIHRYSGVVEFDYELPGYATTGVAADDELVYVTLNGNKVVAFRFPTLIRVAAGKGGAASPADVLASRYTLGATRSLLTDPAFVRPIEMLGANEPVGGIAALQRTPSVSLLPSVTPPYTLSGRRLHATPSLNVLPTLRQPYQFKPDYMQFNQRTPSVSVLPPSVARAFELANLRPKGVQPVQEWSYGAPARLRFPPVRVSLPPVAAERPDTQIERLWLTTDGRVGLALSATNGRPQVQAEFIASVAAPMAGPLTLTRPGRQPDDPEARIQLGFVGTAEGTLVAVDLLGGSLAGPRVEWRANLGGLLNHKPLVTATSILASGEHAGVSNVDVRTGQVIWKTDITADLPLAVNDEFVYVRDRLGNLLVYDRTKPTDPATRRAEPLARMPVPGFNVPVTNHQTDRILLATEGGVMVCLRDSSVKYATAKPVAPPPPAPVPPKKQEAEPLAEEEPN